MKDLNLIMNFITAAKAIAELSDDSHFELTFSTDKCGEQVIKVDVLSADDTTELEDRHWNECRQIAHYDDELRQAKAEVEKLQKIKQRQADLVIEERGQKYEHMSTISILNKKLSTARAEALKEFAEALKTELSNLSKVNLFGSTFSLVGESFVDKFVERYEKGEENG